MLSDPQIRRFFGASPLFERRPYAVRPTPTFATLGLQIFGRALLEEVSARDQLSASITWS